MARPNKVKFIDFEPSVVYFKPQGVPLNELENVDLTYEELEAIRLFDLENLNQIESAEKMGIHQSTFQRVISKARQKISNALVNGKAIKIIGGNYKMPNRDGTGPLGGGFGRARDLGRMQPETQNKCVCTNCKYEEIHITGQPCNKKVCPKCGTILARQ